MFKFFMFLKYYSDLLRMVAEYLISSSSNDRERTRFV